MEEAVNWGGLTVRVTLLTRGCAPRRTWRRIGARLPG